jgi:hypothetical protein
VLLQLILVFTTNPDSSHHLVTSKVTFVITKLELWDPLPVEEPRWPSENLSRENQGTHKPDRKTLEFRNAFAPLDFEGSSANPNSAFLPSAAWTFG